MSQPTLYEMLTLILPKMTPDFIFKFGFEGTMFYLTADQTRDFYEFLTDVDKETMDEDLCAERMMALLSGWSDTPPEGYEDDEEDEESPCPTCGCTCNG